MPAKVFEDLEVWRKADPVASSVYELTARFPSHQRFVLIPQMQRAALSIPANITEGFGRRLPRDKARFYNIAEELRYYFTFAAKQGYVTGTPPALDLLHQIRRMLRSLTDMTLAQAPPRAQDGLKASSP